MSDANLQSKNLGFNLSIIAQAVGGDTDVTTIDTGVLSYLEIEDNLINPGITGNVAIKNSYNIMDRLGTFSSTEKNLFLDINIEDKDSKTKHAADSKISLLTILENSSTITKNITDNIIVFKFEEAQTSMLKKTSMQKLWQTGSKPDKSPSNTLIGHVGDIIEMWGKTLPGKDNGNNLTDNSFKGGGIKVNLQSYWWDIEDSVFDVITRLVSNIQIESSLPLFTIQSLISEDDNSTTTRKFTLKKMFTDKHHEFLKGMLGGVASTGDFSEVYLEEFVLAPQEDKTGGRHSSGMFNTVEVYDLVKADVETARSKYWCDYLLNNSAPDLTTTDISITDFTDIVSSFEENDLGDTNGFNCALPVLRGSDKKILKVDRVDESVNGISLLEDQVFNKVKNSFLFLNDIIVFNVRGQVFRKPGTFITINGGEVTGRTAPDNIWFVVSVKHIFRELDYENEVVAVRLFGNSKRYKELSPSINSEREPVIAQPTNAPTNLLPIGDVTQTGDVNRERIRKELEGDPDLQRLLYASTAAEVGSQGEAAQQAYMETVTNRAAASGRSLRSILQDPGYYPDSTKEKLNNQSPPNYNDQLNRVLAGSNITNLATDNASSGLADRRVAAGNPSTRIGGELFYANYYGSKVGGTGVPKYKVWREGQIKDVQANTADEV
tara:strand:- start:2350 stop:4338 length:1989 start_codon:yes stop_codon:yes gene_type:complete